MDSGQWPCNMDRCQLHNNHLLLLVKDLVADAETSSTSCDGLALTLSAEQIPFHLASDPSPPLPTHWWQNCKQAKVVVRVGEPPGVPLRTAQGRLVSRFGEDYRQKQSIVVTLV